MNNQYQLDLLVVNPGSRMQIYQALGSELSALEPPVWAGLLATFIRNHGYSVHILDANAENLSPLETAERIDDMAPLLTVVVVYGHQPSASTQVMPFSSEVCTMLKQISPERKVL
ncbi:MAG: B12-binding domain-containing radical SAM protein, partial [bacterium]